MKQYFRKTLSVTLKIYFLSNSVIRIIIYKRLHPSWVPEPRGKNTLFESRDIQALYELGPVIYKFYSSWIQ